MGRIARRLGWPLHRLAGVRGRLFPGVPVGLGTGIGLWFAWPAEPAPWAYVAMAMALLGLALLWRLGPDLWHPVVVALACVLAGGLAAGARAHLVAAPVIEGRYYGPILGRVVEVDKSQSDKPRLTLDRVHLPGRGPPATPARVRVSLHGGAGDYLTVVPGQMVMLTGHLAAPQGPVEPGSFDFRRMAWFDRLGGVGYTRSPVLLWAPPDPGAQAVNRLRARLTAGIQAAIPGDAGAFAAGVMTGDRSGLSLAAVEALRDSSLAHLLAISGMNMAFLTGFVFATLRGGIALVPVVALRMNAKKLAAVVALAVAGFYLALSGANVATERAFLMVAVMLGAVLLDRRALTLRSVALAATALLLWQPEALLEPGFQMSFAATVALIVGFRGVEGQVLHGRIPRLVLPVFTLVLSSALAGLATAPFSAAHFNRIADLGFFANLLTVPVMGAVVMPAGAVAAVLAPLGLADLPLWVMGQGAAWILWVAHQAAGWEGAVTRVPAPGPWVLPLITVAGLALAVLAGRWRWLGLAPLALALALWAGAGRPALLISADGRLAGLAGPAGRALSTTRGAGFAATSWLENDGDGADQAGAAARPGFTGPDAARAFTLAGWRGVILKGKGAADRLSAACAKADLVILPEAAPDPAPTVPPDCTVLDAQVIAAMGGLRIDADGSGGLLLRPARRAARLWDAPKTAPLPPRILTRPQARMAQGAPPPPRALARPRDQ